MDLRTPLSRAMGLGTARGAAVAHWWAQRVTSVALVPLTVWFVFALIGVVGADYAAAVEWLSRPWNTVLLVVYLAVLFHHAQLGLQVVIEDYVHAEGVKLASLLAVKFAAVILALAAIFAVLRVSLGD